MHDHIITMSDSVLQILDDFISIFNNVIESPGEQPGMMTLNEIINEITWTGVVS